MNVTASWNIWGIKFKSCRPHQKFFRQYRTKIVRQMRRQIFRQMKQKAEWILAVFTSIFVKYEGKFASRWRAKSTDVLCAVLPLERLCGFRTVQSFCVYR